MSEIFYCPPQGQSLTAMLRCNTQGTGDYRFHTKIQPVLRCNTQGTGEGMGRMSTA